MESLTIVIGGEAGQGLVTVGQLLAKGLVRCGYYIVVTQGYESRIRGGHNTFAIRVSADPIHAPCEMVDVLVALDDDTITIDGKLLTPNGVMIADEKFTLPDDLSPRGLAVPYSKLARGKSLNVAAVGVAAAILGMPQDLLASLVTETFADHPEAADENASALSAAFDWINGREAMLPPAKEAGKRLTMNGTDAVALGAMAAGVTFCSFYPMSPATAISLTLAEYSTRTGVIVEQAEDEIAAINMALGAAYAGARSIVPTSGGGFALMSEGVSLAGMTETPVVIVVGQRPGPATGLPTRTEQADLEFVLRAGHGEFPRAIFAPADIEECFHLTRKAFDVSLKYQIPAFVLIDQFLADSYRAVEPFAAKDLKPVASGIGRHTSSEPYKRYHVTDSGVSPRLLPGMSENLVVADSDEHTEDGHITEDLTVRKAMVDKRLRKLDGVCTDVLSPTCVGDPDPDILFVTWGSSRGSVEEAAEDIRGRGKKTAVLSFSQVWPLVPEQFERHLLSAGRTICVEGNATGQFARLLRAECCFDVSDRLPRYDGLPITPEYVLRALKI